ncbi:LysE family translocator [Streptomyces alboflavus]|uniref:LysE family translocator n=1 Tax=Streptomyces alboflavus TaxID=67267 RepID=UPI0036B46D13
MATVPGARRPARLLTGLGTVAALPSALAGCTDWAEQHEQQMRTGVVQAAANATVVALYGTSFVVRGCVAVAAGLGAVLAASEPAFAIIKWCGVVYLVWLGARSILTGVRRRTEEEVASAERTRSGSRSAERSVRRLARQECVVAVTNPKVLILFTVFLPQFLVRGAEGVAVPLLALGAAYITASAGRRGGCRHAGPGGLAGGGGPLSPRGRVRPDGHRAAVRGPGGRRRDRRR